MNPANLTHAELEALLDLEPLSAPPAPPDMCECGFLPAPCGCVTIELVTL